MGNRKLKVGDRVKYTSGIYRESIYNPLWRGEYGEIKGTLISIIRDDTIGCPLYVKWDNEIYNYYGLNDLELVEGQRQLNIFGGGCG